MRKIILGGLLLLPMLSIAQKNKVDSQKVKAHEELISFLEKKEFVVKANSVRGRYGNQQFVDPTTNFVTVADSVGVVQIAFPGIIGRNGLGGETVDGKVTNYKITDREIGKGAVVKVTFFGYYTMDFFFNVSAGRFTTVNMNGMWGQRLTFRGELVPLEGSNIYVGIATF